MQENMSMGIKMCMRRWVIVHVYANGDVDVVGMGMGMFLCLCACMCIHRFRLISYKSEPTTYKHNVLHVSNYCGNIYPR